MTRNTSLLVVAIVALSAGISFASDLFPGPNIVGTTGIVRIPTADVLPYKNFNIGMDYGSNSISKKGIFFYKMNLGTFQGLELGITGGSADNEDRLREGVFVNMKYSLSTGNYDNPLFLAIGVENLASYYKTDVYMVATRYLKEGPKLHFGFMGDFPGEKFRPFGMLGAELPFWDRFLFMTDLLAGETAFQLDVGLRYYVSPTFVVNISGLNVTYDETSNKEYKDPKSVLLGIAWTNPF